MRTLFFMIGILVGLEGHAVELGDEVVFFEEDFLVPGKDFGQRELYKTPSCVVEKWFEPLGWDDPNHAAENGRNFYGINCPTENPQNREMKIAKESDLFFDLLNLDCLTKDNERDTTFCVGDEVVFAQRDIFFEDRQVWKRGIVEGFMIRAKKIADNDGPKGYDHLVKILEVGQDSYSVFHIRRQSDTYERHKSLR